MITNPTNPPRLQAIVALAGAIVLACTSGGTPETIDLEVSRVFVTEPLTDERAAMYFSVTNNGSDDDELLAVSTAVAGVAELHRTEHEGGVMKMEPVDALTVPAGARIDLAPGSYHVMLLELREQLLPGDRIDVTLRFRYAGEMTVRAEVLSYADIEEALDEVREHDRRGGR